MSGRAMNVRVVGRKETSNVRLLLSMSRCHRASW